MIRPGLIFAVLAGVVSNGGVMSARDKLVFGTIDLMQRRGVSAKGLSDILHHSDVSRRSVYLNFPGGKPELVATATQIAGESITAEISSACDVEDPATAMISFIRHWKTALADSDYAAGCPIAAAAAARVVAPAAAATAGSTFQTWHQVLVDALTSWNVPAARRTSLATVIIAAVQGAVVMAVAEQSMQPIIDIETELPALVADVVAQHQ